VVAVERSLGEYVELLPVYTFDEAVKRLRTAADIGLILCGIYFAQTRMFDLLRLAKAEFPQVPFVACRIGETEIPQVTLEAVGIAARSLGAVAFVNMPLLRPDDGADQEFRSLVLAQLKSPVQLR
jgi:hypothetical protein